MALVRGAGVGDWCCSGTAPRLTQFSLKQFFRSEVGYAAGAVSNFRELDARKLQLNAEVECWPAAHGCLGRSRRFMA